MNWLYLTLLSVLFVSIANILQRVLMKGDKSNPYSYAIVFHILLGTINLAFALLFGSNLSLFSGNIVLLILSSLLWGICTIFLFKALQLLEASEVTILSTIRIVITIIASMVFLQEVFNNQRVLGTIIIIASTILVANLKKGFRFNKGVIYVLAMSLFAGLAIVADSFNVKHYDVLSYNAIQNFLSGIFLLLFYPKALQQWKQFIQPSFLKKMLPLVIFSTIQGVAYLLALTTPGVTAQVATIRQASVILTVVLSISFLGEKDNLLRKLGAAILVTIGVILLS